MVASDNNSGDGQDSQLIWQATTGGTYFLDASGNADSTGTYLLSFSKDDVAATTNTNGRLANGAPVAGEIEKIGDRDWYRTSLNRGATYSFDLEGAYTAKGTLQDPYFRLYDGNGQFVTYDDDGGTNLNSRLVYTSPTSDYFYAGAGAYADGGVGTYTLTGLMLDDLANSNALAALLTVGASVNGNLEELRDWDWMQLALTSGTSYTFGIQPVNHGIGAVANPVLHLIGTDGQSVLTWNWNGHSAENSISYDIAADGTYYLAVASANYASTGGYTITTGESTAGGADQLLADTGGKQPKALLDKAQEPVGMPINDQGLGNTGDATLSALETTAVAGTSPDSDLDSALTLSASGLSAASADTLQTLSGQEQEVVAETSQGSDLDSAITSPASGLSATIAETLQTLSSQDQELAGSLSVDAAGDSAAGQPQDSGLSASMSATLDSLEAEGGSDCGLEQIAATGDDKGETNQDDNSLLAASESNTSEELMKKDGAGDTGILAAAT